MLDKCKHIFCGECFKEFYRTQIEEEYKHHDLKCPEYGCDTKPTEQEVRNIIDSNCFDKFIKFQKNTQVS